METNLQATSVNLHQPAILKVEGVKELDAEIKRLSKEMKQVEITEENLQHYKKLLAEVRKKWAIVDRQRIDIKNEVLTPYNEFASQLNDIKRELLEGETHIKKQLDELVQQQRLERYNELKEMYSKQLDAHKAPHWLTFESFIKNKETLYTNGSTSNRKKVDAINEFFKNYNEDYAKLKEEYPLEDDRTAILLSYSVNGFDMQDAVASFAMMRAEKERLRKAQEEKANKVKVSFGSKPAPKPKPVEKVFIEVAKKDLTELQKYGIVYKVINK